MSDAIPDGYRRNAAGHLVPEAQIREHDKLRDAAVLSLAEEAKELSARLAQFKKRALGDIDDVVKISAERYQVKLGGKKGNVGLISFDGKFKVERAYANRITFGEELLAAKALIDECIKDWSQGANDHLKALVDRAFKVTKQGNINTADVLDLLRVEIDDPAWKRAMQALRDSILITGQAIYIRVYERVGDTEKYQPVSLNLTEV